MKDLPTNLQDYSGEYIPELQYENLSKQTLVKLARQYSKLLVAIDGIWNNVVAKEVGFEKALDWETEVWERYYALDLPRIAEILNIQGDDVVTALKLMQFTPDGYNTGGQYVADIDVRSKNDVIFTIARCRTLEYFERHGHDYSIKRICCKGGVEELAFKKYTQFFNPNIQVTGLKLPPRKSPDDIACQWEFKLEPKA